ncbi:hypothetical protein ABBQ38_014410 [Trebouxia sp. C0009 RCD-2024]
MVALPSATIISVTIALLWCGKLLDVEIASRSRLLHDDACEPLHELKGLTNAIMQQRDLEAISEVGRQADNVMLSLMGTIPDMPEALEVRPSLDTVHGKDRVLS